MNQIVEILNIGQIQGKSFQRILSKKWVEFKSYQLKSDHLNFY